MIRFVEEMSPDALLEYRLFCEKSAFGLKALGPVLSYGLSYDFVMAWEQRDDDGQLTAFLSKYYGTVTLCTKAEGDLSPNAKTELLSFLNVIGFSALVGPAGLLRDAFPEGETGCVMALGTGSDATLSTSEEPGLSLVRDDRYRDFYEVLTKSNPGYVAEDYGSFLTDFSHRVRHGTASSVLLCAEGRPVATAAALVIGETTVFLGAVSTVPEGRGRHYASTCLQALCERFSDRTVFLFCRPDKQAFYEHLGFIKTDDHLELASSRK